MKSNLLKLIVVLSILLLRTVSFGQFWINNTNGANTIYRDLQKTDYEKLEKSTLYFVYPDYLMNEDDEEFEQLFNASWKYCPLKLIRQNEINDHIREKNASFLSINFLINGNGNTLEEIYYELWMINDLSKEINSNNKTVFATFSLLMNCDYYNKFIIYKPDEFRAYINLKGKYSNLNSGIASNYLKLISSYLVNKKRMKDIEICNKSELKNLQSDTLYITDNVKINTKNSFDHVCSYENIDVEELMKKYKHAYQIISFKELNEKILEGDKFYYLIYMPYNNYMTIYNSVSGECIYNKEYRYKFTGGLRCRPDLLATISKKIGK